MRTKIFIALIASLAASSAFAYELTCNQPGKNGYKINADIGMAGMDASATLKVPGERGRRRLSCGVPAISPGRRGGDQTYPIAFCNEGKSPGYSINLSGGGQVGKPKATISFTGKSSQDDVVATFYCN